jgi:2-phosphosulfolactate phosphatase
VSVPDPPAAASTPAEAPAIPPAHRQLDWELRFDWGRDGLAAASERAGAVVVVDVLRFTTAVSVAAARGAEVLPYPWGMGDAARAYAADNGAELAGQAEGSVWSLSPVALGGLPPATRIVLPSPNGSAICFAARDEVPGALVLAGCLRNAAAVAAVADEQPGPVVVLAAGERWEGSLGPLRPAVEDLLGAGAVLRHLVDAGDRPAKSASPEARAAIAVFDAARDNLAEWLAGAASGRELLARGHHGDVEVAAALDADAVAPVLRGRVFEPVVPGRTGHLR